MPPSMKVHVHWMNLMKNQIIQKCSNFEILKERVARQKTHFFNHLTKKKRFNGLKMSSFRCRSHVQEIILPKNMFGCPFKLIFRFSLGLFAFLATNQNIYTRLCMNVKIH